MIRRLIAREYFYVRSMIIWRPLETKLGNPWADSDEFSAGVLRNLPHLRAFARMIARDHALAEDLVQDTVVQALAKRSQFRSGTNLKGWLIIILRNRFFNEMRRSRRKSEVYVEHPGNFTAIDGGQEINIEIRDFKSAFGRLPPAQREALVLVGASGFSYAEAAAIAGCPIGTMKSRVARARMDLQSGLDGIDTDWKAPRVRRIAPAEVREPIHPRASASGAVGLTGRAVRR